MTVAQIKGYLQVAATIANSIAPLTETKIDDKLAALITELSKQEAMFSMLIALFSGDDDPKPSQLTDEQSHLWQQVLEHKDAVKSLVDMAAIACHEDFPNP